LLEYQYDGRDESEPVTIADNDVFVAARLALNDTQDTAVLAGFSYDIETSRPSVVSETTGLLNCACVFFQVQSRETKPSGCSRMTTCS
jgi:hypothetical protein